MSTPTRYADRAAQILLIAAAPNMATSEQLRQIAALLEQTRSEGVGDGVNIGVKHFGQTLDVIGQIMGEPPRTKLSVVK